MATAVACRHSSRHRWRLYDPAPVLAPLQHLDDGAVARRLGVSREQVNRWRNGRHWLQPSTADRLALAVGSHPMLLWPDYGAPCPYC